MGHKKSKKNSQKCGPTIIVVGGGNRCPSECSSESSSESCDDKKHQIYDYIIVGAGASGCALARLLTEPRTSGKVPSVLVLERGLDVRGDPLVEIASSSCSNQSCSSGLSQFEDQIPTTTGPDALNIPFAFHTGKGTGGSTAHYFMTAVRGGPESTYDKWAAIAGNPDFTYDNMLPLMKEMENFIPYPGTPVDVTQRGFNGLLTIDQNAPIDPTNPQVAAEIAAADVPVVPDYNVDIEQNFSNLQNYQHIVGGTTYRIYGGNAYLGLDVLDRNGNGIGGRPLHMIWSTTASKVLFGGSDRHRAKGVEYVTSLPATDAKPASKCVTRAYARKEVIICSGPQSAPLLERSGIGSVGVLSAIGATPLVVNENVGNHFLSQNGPNVSFTKTHPHPPPVGTRQWFTDGHPYLPSTGLRYLQMSSGGSVPAQVLIGAGIPTSTPNYTYKSWNCLPLSEGSVHATSLDPEIQPQVVLNTFSDPGGVDAAAAIAGARIIRQIGINLGETQIWPPEAHFATGSEALLLNDLKASPSITNHYIGVCRMGSDPTTSVVDGHMRVWGTRALRVLDISIWPTGSTGNPGYESYLFAYYLARELLA